MIRALKYFLVFVLPTLFILGFDKGSWFSLGPVIFAFGAVPILEFLFKPDPSNLTEAEELLTAKDPIFDWILYLVLPMIYGCVFLGISYFTDSTHSNFEKFGIACSLGVILGGIGINVAHELGHRPRPAEQFLAKALLLPVFYMHFFIEHNQGHHKNVGSDADPASSKLNESLYAFWLRSLWYSYQSAWKIENKRLSRKGLSAFSLKNQMLRFQILQALFLGLVWYVAGAEALWFVLAAILGFLLLETVNYIEHYGLRRKQVSANRLEKIQPIHSWNSDHIMGRLLLFELSRHSDHHYAPGRKFQILKHHEHSPQMPTGYPSMMLLSLIPPIWFKVMNPRIPNLNSEKQENNLV